MLRDKVAIVTGSSRGIGKAIALKYAEMGAKVVLNHRKSDKEIEDVECKLKEIGASYLIFKGSVTDREFVKDMIKEVKIQWKHIDILVNNAGIIKDCPLLLMSEKSWNDVIDVNLKGTFYLCKETISTMMAQKDGRIVNISSLTAIAGREGQTNYGAAKAGVLGFTRSLAREVGKYGIRVNAIVAGLVDTQMTKKIPKEIINQIIPMIPLGRFANPEEIANVALFLASDMSSYMTGAVLNVSGGEYM